MGPCSCTDPKGGRKPINARSETVATLATFRDAYRRRRCILPVDAFYEWKASKGGKEPYAIAMKDRAPFGIAGIWENWKNPDGEWVRTFAVLTTPANELVGMIHDRMPAVLARADYDRWLGTEPDPRDLLQPFPSELMAMWPISRRVNSPSNDDEHLLEEIAVAKGPGAVITPKLFAAHPLSDHRTRKTATRHGRRTRRRVPWRMTLCVRWQSPARCAGANSRASPSPKLREAPIMIVVFRSRFGAVVTMRFS